jgi:hypothetical protein
MGEPNGEPTSTGIRPRQATSSHSHRWWMPRQATSSHGTNSPYKRGAAGSNPAAPTVLAAQGRVASSLVVSKANGEPNISQSGVPVEEIARLAGHKQTSTTELVCRQELRPVITTGAELMDKVFSS